MNVANEWSDTTCFLDSSKHTRSDQTMCCVLSDVIERNGALIAETPLLHP